MAIGGAGKIERERRAISHNFVYFRVGQLGDNVGLFPVNYVQVCCTTVGCGLCKRKKERRKEE